MGTHPKRSEGGRGCFCRFLSFTSNYLEYSQKSKFKELLKLTDRV